MLLNAVPGAAHRGHVRRPRACARGTWNGAAARAASSSRTATSTSPTPWPRKGSGDAARDGRFSLGYPRKDGGEEINARRQRSTTGT
ncbi:MAG: hypothetical protein MZV64_13735 [Ignavibacteriales bacterium]|nr:hypothetical protein [Ignavibacteriales bacterium]